MLTHVEEQFDVLDLIRQRELCKEATRSGTMLPNSLPMVNPTVPEGTL